MGGKIKRICLNCGSSKTWSKKNGYECWTKYKNGFLCNSCRCKLISNPIHNPLRHFGLIKGIHNKRYRTKLTNAVKIDVCNLCRAVKGFDCKQTQLCHIDDKYDFNNWLKYTLECCPKCHKSNK